MFSVISGRMGSSQLGAMTTLLLLVQSGLCAAESTASLSPGSRVRAVLDDGRPSIYRVVHASDASLTLRPWTRIPEPSFDVPWSRVRSLEQSLGSRRGPAARKGALNGAFTGALVGGLLGVLAGSSPGNGECICCDVGTCVALGIGVFTPPATLVGAAVGAASASERWTPIDRSVPMSTLHQSSALRTDCVLTTSGHRTVLALRLSF